MNAPVRRLAARALAAALALACALPAPVAAQVRLPSLGETASDDFSVSTERRTGEQIMREIRRDPAYLDDPVLLEYVRSLWQPLVAAARQRGDIAPELEHQFPFESFLVLDRSVNAFALPGGYVGVHLGLIALTTTGDELASVLAHELSHVTQRHIARSIGNSQRVSMIGLVGMILGILAASRTGNVDMANAAIMSGQAAAIQGQLNFSRDMEREADRLGFGVLGAAGFSPKGMSSMFEKMDNASRLNDNGAFPYLRTHPLTIERVAEARSRALMNGSAPTTPPLRHAMMQARARALMDTDPQQLNRLQDQAAGSAGASLRDRVAYAYAGALAASIQRNHPLAEKAAGDVLALAQQANPREPQAEQAARLLLAQVRLARGDAVAAQAALDAMPAEGQGRAALLARAQTRLDLQRQGRGNAAALRESTESLQTWVAEHPADAAAWGLLAGTAEAAGLPLRALRAAAEARAAIGDLNGAIDRLRAGQSAARGAAGQDFIEASVIDARLRELTAQRRALALEARGGRAPRDEEPPPPQ